MDFHHILDDLSRRDPKGSEGYRPSSMAQFRQVLGGIVQAPPLSEAALKDAYFPDGLRRTPATEEIVEADLSLDPDDIAYELDLSSVLSLEELSSLRRKFAMLNHPDRVRPALRVRAGKRMTLANAMIDEAAKRFSR